MSDQKLVARPIFNPTGDDSLQTRELVGGNATGIINLNNVKYKWAGQLSKQMVNNFWIPEKVSLVDDKVTIKELTADELEAVKNTLSFLIALDSMQVNNLPRLGDFITAPEVAGLFIIQAYQEYVHSQSYQYLLLELFPSIERDAIYDRWRSNPLLLKRNSFIAEKYQRFNDEQTLEAFKIALAANFALEGIYFYNGFNLFYQLASRNKITNVAKMIKYIENDEVTHVSMFAFIIREYFDFSNEADVAILRGTIEEAVEEEIAWAHEVYGDKLLGISKQSAEQYVKYVANQRARAAGLGTIYPGFSKNPYAYLSSDKRENFFETTVTEYSQSSAVSGWDDF